MIGQSGRPVLFAGRPAALLRGAAIALTLFAAATSLGGCGDDDTEGPPAEGRAVTVEIRDVTFAPKNLTVEAGTAVRWTNRDAEILHTVTKAGGPGEAFDSGNIYPGATYERTFESPGRFDYVCTLHDGQVGSVTVRGTYTQ